MSGASTARADTPASASERSAPMKSLTLAAMSLGYGIVQLDVTIVNTALSSIGETLGGGVSELQWVVSAYTIAFAALILTAGALGDRVGAKKVFMAGFAIFTAASFACALAPNALTLIAARAMQGAGAAILVPNSLALLNHAYRRREGARPGDRNMGCRSKPCAHRWPARRRNPHRARRLAQHFSRQSTDRSCRSLVDMALCERDGAFVESGKSILPGKAPRSARSAVWPARSSKEAPLAGAISMCWQDLPPPRFWPRSS